MTEEDNNSNTRIYTHYQRCTTQPAVSHRRNNNDDDDDDDDDDKLTVTCAC